MGRHNVFRERTSEAAPRVTSRAIRRRWGPPLAGIAVLVLLGAPAPVIDTTEPRTSSLPILRFPPALSRRLTLSVAATAVLAALAVGRGSPRRIERLLSARWVRPDRR